MLIIEICELKNYLIDEHKIPEILEALGCHSIVQHGNYISCGNPDGDNKFAIITYLNDNITVIDYTRQIADNKRTTDIFDLVSFIEGCSFPEAIKYVCNLCQLNYYEDFSKSSSLKEIIGLILGMQTEVENEGVRSLPPIEETILNYFLPYPNIMFINDGIKAEIQNRFQIGYDPVSNYITIPIRDMFGTLVGIKGRYFGEPDERHTKYTYLVKCNKSQVLYGYYENKDIIHNSTILYVLESEKAVMQLSSMGIRNCVSTGGKNISKAQVELLTRIGRTIVFAYDKDVQFKELQNIAKLFMDNISIYAIFDKNNILDEKESPSDNPLKWEYLINNNIYKVDSNE